MHSIADLFALPLTDPIMIFFVIVLAVFVMPWLARRLGFPEVIALIALGIILGPHVLGVLERDRVIKLFASVGLLFLMFIAGLEIDGNDFRKYRGKSLWFGFLTFIIPMVLGTLAGLYILRFNLTTSILLASMFASHTLLAYPIAMKLRINSDPAVGAAVGGTIITDVAALLVLAVIAGMNRGEFGPAMIIQMSIGLAIFTVFELFVLPRLAGAIFEKLEKEADLQFLFSLLVLFGSGILAEVAGVEPIIGAFLAGIAIGRHIPPVSPLANRIEFFGNTVFVPAFLISVGMIVDPRAFIGDRQSIVVSVVMVLCVIIAKWLAAQLAGLSAGWDKNRRNVVFGLSVVQAAATLAAVLVGFELKIFDASVMNGTIVMIMVTVILGSITVQRAGSAMAEIRDQHSGPDNQTRRWLLSVDNHHDPKRLLELNLFLRDQEDELKAVTVIPINEANAATVAEAERNLKDLEKIAAASSLAIQTASRADASAIHGLNGAATEFLASEILVGLKSKRGLFEYKSKKFIENLAHGTKCRLIIARLSSTATTIEHIQTILPENSHNISDFAVTIEMIKNLARNSRARLVCYGSTASIAAASEVLEAKPPLGSVEYLELGFRAALSSATRTAGRSLLVILAQRPSQTNQNLDLANFLVDIDVRHKNRDMVLIFASQSDKGQSQKGLAGFLHVMRSRLPIKRG